MAEIGIGATVATLVAGAVLGVAAQEIHRVTMKGVKRASSFRDELEVLQSTLKTVSRKIDQIDELTSKTEEIFKEIQKFKPLLERAKVLVMTWSEIPSLSIWKKHRYAKRIRTLNESLGHLAEIHLPGVELDVILGILTQTNQELLSNDIVAARS